MRRIAAALFLLASILPAHAQRLTQSEIEAAVAAGGNMRPDQAGHGIRGGIVGVWSEARLVVHSPTSWVQLAAAEAKAAFKPFSVKDVTEEMAAPVLRVLFFPGSACQHMVILDVDKREAVQPLKLGACGQIRTFRQFQAEMDCVEAQFDLADVRRIQQTGNGEFRVFVQIAGYSGIDGSGTTFEKDFKVGRSDLKKLPGLASR